MKVRCSFLSCLPENEITAYGDFLGRPVGVGAQSGGSGSTGPTSLLLLCSAVFLMRRHNSHSEHNPVTIATSIRHILTRMSS